MNLQWREAEFQHLCETALQYSASSQPDSEASIELFDSLDCLCAAELTEVVTIYLLGNQKPVLNYAEAHSQALTLGFEGVALLHATPSLNTVLLQGLQRLKQYDPIYWKD